MTGPLVTFALIAYRHERFIAEAIRGALAQDYRPLEILIIDDASPDRTVAVIQEELDRYTGQVPIRFLRNPTNIGLIPVINRVMDEAKGTIIVGAAGDDVSSPTRTSETVRVFEEYPDAHSVYSNAVVITEDGQEQRIYFPAAPDARWHTADHAAREGLAVLGASHAWRREVFEVFGPLPRGANFEDHAISFRSSLLGSIRYLDRILIRYRQHGSNIYLGTTEASESVSDWHRRIEKFVRGETGMLQARLVDLDAALERLPQQRDGLLRLRRLTEIGLEERTDQLRLLAGASLITRVGIIAKRAFRGMPPRRVARWVLTFLFPRYYLRRIQRRTAAVRPDAVATGQ